MSALAPAPPRQAGAPRPDLRTLPQEVWPEVLEEHFEAGLPGLLGLEILEIEPGRVVGRLPLRDAVMQTAGDYLHGGTIVAFADSCAGWGSMASLPPGRAGFTTIDLSTSFVATTKVPDALLCVARLVHGGRTTQIWDATVTRERDGREIAHLRATQFLLAAQR
jgi:1,4-dihydroxy-2-naphthoyl-CoA hydrolase